MFFSKYISQILGKDPDPDPCFYLGSVSGKLTPIRTDLDLQLCIILSYFSGEVSIPVLGTILQQTVCLC